MGRMKRRDCHGQDKSVLLSSLVPCSRLGLFAVSGKPLSMLSDYDTSSF